MYAEGVKGEVKDGGCGVVDPGGRVRRGISPVTSLARVRRMNRCEVDGGSGVESTVWLLFAHSISIVCAGT